ncbi:MAG: lamin tail domain-containing protein, partial [Flavobacteriaceae bacterium]|nr:lamin tail domain-containing protein [Flavobacteriaceae bacterium]
MKIKLFLFKNWLLFFAINFLFIQLAVAQTHGDYRSVASGPSNWTTLTSWEYYNGSIWITPTSYPGQLAGTNTVTIQMGHNIQIGTNNLNTETIGSVIINGELNLVAPNTNQFSIILNTTQLTISGAGSSLNFNGVKVKLTLSNGAGILISEGGVIGGSCTNNDEIFIGSQKLAVCVGAGSGQVFTFGELIDAGGSLNAAITSPSTNQNDVCIGTTITLIGNYIGVATDVTYEWSVITPDNATVPIIPDILSSGSLPNTTTNASSSFLITNSGQYLFRFVVSGTIGGIVYSHLETVTVTVVNTPPIAIAKDVIVQLNDLGTASVTPEQVNNGSSDNCGITSMSLSRSTFSCSDAKPILSDLIISEYVEGSNNNKYIEIYNGTNSDIDLSNYRLRTYYDGASSPLNDIQLTGILLRSATVVYANASANIYSGVKINNAAVNFNGDDTIVLFKISTNAPVDIFGRIGEDPGTAWTAGGNTTIAKTLRRKSTVLNGITVNSTSGFPTLGTEWESYNKDDISGLGNHCLAAVVPVALTVTDTDGNSSIAYANVFVVDTSAPTWTTTSTELNRTIECSDAVALTTAQALAPVATDNCGTVTYTKTSGSFVAGSCGNAGTYTNTWVARDACSNTSTTFTQVISIQDTSAPTWTTTSTELN